jgi:hypothetical protein
MSTFLSDTCLLTPGKASCNCEPVVMMFPVAVTLL